MSKQNVDWLSRYLSEGDNYVVICKAIEQLESMAQLDETQQELLEELRLKKEYEEMAAKQKTKKAAKKNTAASAKAKKAARTATKTTDGGHEGALKTMASRYDKSRSCGDEIASALKKFVEDHAGNIETAVSDVGTANGIDVAARWGHLNAGMQRMNLGNCLRGKASKGEGVVIGDFVIAPTAKAKDNGETVKTPAKAKPKAKAKAKPKAKGGAKAKPTTAAKRKVSL